NVWNFFTIEEFGWSTSQVGRSLGVFGILFAISQALLVGFSTRYIGVTATVVIGLSLAVVAFVGVSFIHTELGLWTFLVIGSFSGIAAPALTGLLANNARPNQQGELQGAVNASNSLTAIIAPVAATQLFSFFTNNPLRPVTFPGAPFFAAGLLVAGSIALFIFAAFKFNLSHKPYDEARKRPRYPQPSGQAVNPPDEEDIEQENENGDEEA